MDESMKFVSEAIAAAIHSSMAEVQKSIDASIQASVQSSLGGVHKSIEILSQSLNKEKQRQINTQMALLTVKINEMKVQNRQIHSTVEEEVMKNSISKTIGRSPLTEFENRRGGHELGGSNRRSRKGDIPLFDGSDPEGWISRAENCFEFHRLSEEDKSEAAVVALEGDALDWYQWEHHRRPIRGWEELKGLVLRRFRSSRSIAEPWWPVFHDERQSELQWSLMELTTPLKYELEKSVLVHCTDGLKDDKWAEIEPLGPVKLDQALESIIQIGNEESPPQSKATSGKTLYAVISPNVHLDSNSLTQTITAGTTESIEGRASFKPLKEVKGLSEKELIKKDEGVYSWCELSDILTGNRDEKEEDKPKEDLLITEVCLNSVFEVTKPKTHTLKGVLQNEEVVVIDPGGNSHSISLPITEMLQLSVKSTWGFEVNWSTKISVQVDTYHDLLYVKLPSSGVLLVFTDVTGNNLYRGTIVTYIPPEKQIKSSNLWFLGSALTAVTIAVTSIVVFFYIKQKSEANQEVIRRVESESNRGGERKLLFFDQKASIFKAISDILQYLGAHWRHMHHIFDSQAMGCIGEIKSFIAKFTTKPLMANGFIKKVGLVEVGKMANLVIWMLSLFGAKPDMMIKRGDIAWAELWYTMGQTTVSTLEEQMLGREVIMEMEPEDLFGFKSLPPAASILCKVLIKEKGLPATEATWEV